VRVCLIATLKELRRGLRLASGDATFSGLRPFRRLGSDQPTNFSAIPIDDQGSAIQGLLAQWESSNKQVILIKKNGEAMAGKPGTATVVASVGTKQQAVRVTVVAGTNERYGGKKRQDSTRSSRQSVGKNSVHLKTNMIAPKSAWRSKRAHAS